VPTYAPSDSTWRGGELRLLFLALRSHKLMVGIEGQNNPRENEAVDNVLDPAKDFLLPERGYRVGVYIQDEWRLARSLVATIGVREDYNNMTGARVSPRVGLIWQATPATTLKALYGTAYRPPNVYERDYGDGQTQAANLSLKGETIDTIELTADQRIGRDLTMRASVYQWTLKDLIALGIDPVSGLSQYQTGSSAQARGVELSADKTWEGGARLRGSLSVQHAAWVGGGELLNSPRRLGKVDLSTPLAATGVSAAYEMRYDSARLSQDGTDVLTASTVKLGGYAVSDLILSTEALVKGLRLSVGVYNLFDKRYAQPAAVTNWQESFEQDGRSAQFKLSYRY
jgi:iron complex outermembrane receptor protein